MNFDAFFLTISKVLLTIFNKRISVGCSNYNIFSMKSRFLTSPICVNLSTEMYLLFSFHLSSFLKTVVFFLKRFSLFLKML